MANNCCPDPCSQDFLGDCSNLQIISSDGTVLIVKNGCSFDLSVTSPASPFFSVDGDTIDFSGDGTQSTPFTGEVKLSTNPDNLITTDSEGLLALAGTVEVYSGLSMSSPIRLGQVVGAAGDPAALLANTEIPMADFVLVLNNKAGILSSDLAAITFDASNSSGTKKATISLQAKDYVGIVYSVDDITGNLENTFKGSGGVDLGASGVALSGAGGYFYLSDMRGGTTHSAVQIGGVASQKWVVSGDTQIGLFGTKNTGFGGITAPTAFVDIAASTATANALRFQIGVTPSSNYLEGGTWFDGTHAYMRIGGANKQLDNDYNFTPNDFIQRQFLIPQASANFWIDGNGRIDGYLQVETAGRLIMNSSGYIGVSSASDSTLGDDLSVRELHFQYDNASDTFSNSYIRGGLAGANFIDVVTPGGLTVYGPSIGFETSKTSIYPAIGVGGLFPLHIIGTAAGSPSEWNYLDLVNGWDAGHGDGGTAEGLNVRLAFSANRTTGGKTFFGRVGVEITDYSDANYTGDLIFETVDATVNTGNPTEYMRLKSDGTLIVKSLDTDNTAPTTTGTTKDVICDANGVLSFIDIPVPGSPNVPINILVPALNTNNIDNGVFEQVWSWNTLGDQLGGLRLTTSATNASGSGQTVLFVGSTGAQSNGLLISTSAAAFSNAHTGDLSSNYGIFATAQDAGVKNVGIQAEAFGTGSWNVGVQAIVSGTGGTNYAVYANATGGTDNFAFASDYGDIYIAGLPNQTTPDRLVTQISGTSILGYVTLGTNLSMSGGVLNASTAGAQGLQSVLTTDSVLTGNNTIDVNGNNFTFDNAVDFTVEATTLFLKVSGFGSASNGDIPYLVNNTTGEIGWQAPGGAPGSVTSFSSGDLSPLFTTSVATSTTTPALSFSLTNAGAHTYFGNNTGSSAAPAYKSNAAFVRVDDTNVTATLTGNPTTALLETMTLTLGWTGQLSVARGGTGLSSLGSANQLIRVNAGVTALEYFTPTYLTTAVTTLNTLTAATQTFAVGTSGADFNISSSVSTHTFNIPDASITARGLVTTGAQSFEGVKTFNVGVVINESGAASDFRVESDGNANAVFVDGTNNRVGIFTASPAYPLDITGNIRLQSGSLAIGTTPANTSALLIGGSGYTSSGVALNPSVSSAVASSPAILNITGTIVEAASGNHSVVSGLSIAAPTITGGLATVSDATTLYIAGATSATVSGGNYSILVAGGTSRFNGDVVLGVDNSYSSGGFKTLVYNQGSGRVETIEPEIVTLNSQSGTAYTLALTDKAGMVRMSNAGANTLTVPANATVAFTIGTQILILQEGAGQTTISPAVGVTILSADNAFNTRVQYSVATLIKVAINTWLLSGDLVV